MLRPWDFQITIDLKRGNAIYLQIADTIIKAIKDGKLQTGDTLPGSRKLAEQISVNRNTVVKAIDVLLAEGWLETKARKGVFVANIDSKLIKGKILHFPNSDIKNEQIKKPRIIFDDGHPDSRLAPTNALARAYRQLFNRKAKWQLMNYGDPQGDLNFREAVVKMLNHKRGLGLNTSNICITRGSQMALYLTANNLLKKDDLVIIENPGYKPAWEVFKKAGAILIALDVEPDGMSINMLKKILSSGKKIKAVYTTPHHHFPTTVSLSLQKRMALIQLSDQYGFTIIEDDYDHEFHFGLRPLMPLGSLNSIKNYVYIGSFSKIVSPSLRVGYVASNHDLINQITNLRKLIDVQGDTIMQLALLELINDGSIKKHLNKATSAYRKKKEIFNHLIEKYLNEKVTFNPPDGGLAFWLVPTYKSDLFLIAKNLLAKGIQIMTPDQFSFSAPIQGLRLGYASLSEKMLEEGIIEISKQL